MQQNFMYTVPNSRPNSIILAQSTLFAAKFASS